MISSSSSFAPVELLLNTSFYITSQGCVKVLGITIDKQLTFNEHISLCCSKAARHLNAFTRISKYSYPNSRRAINHSFIASKFIAHLSGISVARQTMQNWKRSKNDRCVSCVIHCTSSYEDLLHNVGLSTLPLNRLKCMLFGNFQIHPAYKYRMSSWYIKNTRGPIWSQDHKHGSTYASVNHVRIEIVLGSRLWNELAKDDPFLSLADGFCLV